MLEQADIKVTQERETTPWYVYVTITTVVLTLIFLLFLVLIFLYLRPVIHEALYIRRMETLFKPVVKFSNKLNTYNNQPPPVEFIDEFIDRLLIVRGQLDHINPPPRYEADHQSCKEAIVLCIRALDLLRQYLKNPYDYDMIFEIISEISDISTRLENLSVDIPIELD